MDLHNIIKSIIIVALIQNGAALDPKTSEDDIYDCIGIYKQPAFEHPLLADHRIQMKPSAIPGVGNDHGTSNAMFQKERCPRGTVPIHRTRKNNLINTDRHGETNTLDQPGAHMAAFRTEMKDGVRYHGVKAMISTHNLDIASQQATYAQIWVGGGSGGQINSIQAGWMIQPQLFGDGQTWSFGFWMGNNRTGCYNTLCPGFVQVSKDVSLGTVIYPTSIYGEQPYYITLYIYQDQTSGNWWLTTFVKDSPINIGYWPKELFPELITGAATVGFGGFVQASPDGLSPPMGSGHFPDDGVYTHAAHFGQLQILNGNNQLVEAYEFPLEQLLDSNQCYHLKTGESGNENSHLSFLYGGAGGNCGV